MTLRSSARRTATVAAALLALLGGAALHGAGCTLGNPPIFQFTDVAVSAPATVAPGGTLKVTVTLTNTGPAALTTDDAALDFTGDPAWADASLALEAKADYLEKATFSAELKAPAQTGVFHLTWQARLADQTFGDPIALDVEVTCSDGVFCNGVERFVDGACVPGANPCDDGQACTDDSCDEATGRCKHTPGASCAVCMSDCVPDCTGKACGDDGCGGTCGTCPSGKGCAAATGTCADASQPGTCQSPLPLLMMGESLVGKHVITGDTTNALDQTIPVCNNTSRAGELVYVFTATEKVGIEAESSGYDTVLSLRKTCADDSAKGTIACSDDSSPPGNYGSRINAVVDPGTYFLLVDGFDATQFGPFTLSVRVAPNGCIPNCDGQYCGGDDGCGNDCGTCPAGFACKAQRCYPDPCVPDCGGKTCGDDGCGSTCGKCADGELCVPATGSCQKFEECDHLVPTCTPACKSGDFCGSDCACHPADGALPDLVVDADRLKNELLFDTIHVSPTSCAIAEECVGGAGDRNVLRFSVEAINQGQATLVVPPADQRPDLFTFSQCHGHYHFQGFARYELLDEDGAVVLTGRKQAYCMEDTEQVMLGPQVACSKQYDCSNQGIQAGWSDLYGNALDCQWLDITDVPSGKYTLRVTLNPGRTFQELSFENNTATVPVEIP